MLIELRLAWERAAFDDEQVAFSENEPLDGPDDLIWSLDSRNKGRA